MRPADTNPAQSAELDIEDFDALQLYLAKHFGQVGPVSCKRLTGGVSNRTVRITLQDGREWVLKQALAKLRVATDWFSSPERIITEAKGLRWLNCLAPAGTIPTFIFEDPANHLMAMQAVPAEHENWKSVLLSGHINPDYFEQFGFLLGTIHRRSAQCGPELCKAFGNTAYFESLRLEPYYLYTAQRVAPAASFLKALAQETLRHKLSLVHADYSPKNALIYRGKLILLDYEVVHFGDPAFDVGFALTHFLSKAHHLRQERRLLMDSTALFWSAYFKETILLKWDALESRAVRHTLGCLLARVAGKSPLEYLTSEEVVRQQDVVLRMMANPPTCIEHLIHNFINQIECYADN